MNKDIKTIISENNSPPELEYQFNQLLQEIDSLQIENSKLKEKVCWFEAQFKLSRQRQFGKKTESSLQLPLNIFNAEESESAILAAEASKSKETITYTRNKPNKKGRNIDASQLPRYTVIHDLTDAEKTCFDCQNALQKIGEDKSEQLEIIQEPIFVVEHIRCKYVCRHCDQIKMAAKEPSPIPKSMAGSSLLTSVIINKYQNHLPLYRQSQMFKSHHIDIPDSTLGNWVMQSGESLLPLYDAQFNEIITSNYNQVDETPVQVLKPYKKGYLWVYLSTEKKSVIFDFSLSRSKEVVEGRLKTFSGRLQTDGYAGYQGLREQPRIKGLGCFSHTRRKFVEIVKLAPDKPGKAHEAVAFINELYHIETEAKTRNLNDQERYQLRQEKSKPILNKFYQWLLDTEPRTSRQSPLYQAIRYTINQWPYLIQILEHGDVELDTNLVENQIRPFAVGRRNWLFLGHERSAKIGALFYSLIQTCKLQGLNPALYLHHALTQVHELRKGNIAPEQLLPSQFNQQSLKQAWQQHQDQFQAIFMQHPMK